jgi:hypothetical protein
MQFAEEAYEILQRSAEAIDGPSSNKIELAARDPAAQPIECRALLTPFAGADPLVGERDNDLPTVMLRSHFELTLLVLNCLSRC